MTEAEWLASTDPETMLTFLCSKASARKLRLLAVSCIRQDLIWSLLTPSAQRAVEIAEQFADGLVRLDALTEAGRQVVVPYKRHPPPNVLDVDPYSAEYVTVIPHAALPGMVICWELEHLMPNLFSLGRDLVVSHFWERSEALIAKLASLKVSTATLCRHVIGNPFRPCSSPAPWTPLAADLAQQLYDGADVRLVLHDALLDAGHAELAGHFRAEEWHPKGCFALDAILGRE